MEASPVLIPILSQKFCHSEGYTVGLRVQHVLRVEGREGAQAVHLLDRRGARDVHEERVAEEQDAPARRGVLRHELVGDGQE
eukprot:5993470-Prorocentrum_lima.AAC.1